MFKVKKKVNVLISLVTLYQGSVKISEKSMKIVNIDGENLHIF